MLAQAGEYLVWSDSELNAVPRLAESWTPNEDASVWTFKIRQGVKFHDGKEMTSEDVAASINRLADPESASQALSAFTGFLTKDSAKATDATTVEFSLEAPNGSFPYLLSSDNYNTIILPADYDGDYEKNMNGTGPFILEKFTQGQSATFRKNPDYWDKERQPNPDNTEIRFYGKEQARVLALQSGEVDVVTQFSVSGGRALLTDPNVQTVELKASTHRQVHLRTDKEPFTDKRVRQALALAIDRNGLVDGLFKGRAQLGNDSPFAPVFKYTDTSVAQRQQDIEQAKQLLADAGMPDGFEVQLDTWDGFEIPDLAQLIQNNAKEIGATIKLNITDAAHVLRRRGLRQVALAGLQHGDHGLRPPRHRQRVPRRAAAVRRHLERRALPQQGVRQAGQGLHRPVRHRPAEAAGEADPGAAPGRDADHHPVLLRLPHGRPEGHRGRRDDGHGARPADPRRQERVSRRND